MPKSWIIKDLLKVSADYLKEKGIESPRLTAEVLLAHQLNIDRVNLYLNFDQPLIEKEITGYRSFIKRRVRHEPLQYITGHKEFWSLDFMVNPQVLIPRPESELLVELAVSLINIPAVFENLPPKVLDLGTGCGVLAISLAKEIPHARIWATDLSENALDLARRNAKKHGVPDRIEFLQGDLWEPLTNQGIIFDVILSNPPYVATDSYDALPPEVRDYEPRQALDGMRGGLHFIEKIINKGFDFLSPGGWIILEMAPDQTNRALELVEQSKGYGKKKKIKDHSHLDRVVMAQKA